MVIPRWVCQGSFLLPLFLAACTAGPPRDPMPAFVPGSRILFQGDSITDGNRGRNSDPNHILGHGYQFIIPALYGEMLPERHLTFMNRGISGDTVARLQRRWKTDTLDLHPDILSILIGVNDLGSGLPPATFEQQYDQLLAQTLTALPHIHIVLMEPFGLPVGGKKLIWDASYHAALLERIAIVNRLAAKYQLPIVHLQKVFDDACSRAPADDWIWDGVHPTYSGHELIAKEWIKVVRAAHWTTPATRPAS